MTYTFQLEESDFLTQQLYRMSKLPATRKAKIYGWIGTPVIFIAMGLFFWRSNNLALTWYFIGLTVVAALFYPYYHRCRYKRHCAKHVHNSVREMSDLRMSLTFEKSHALVAGKTGESKLNYSEFKQINEIESHFLLELNSGQTLIVPKSEISNQPGFLTELQQCATAHKIYWNSELNWSWK